MITFSPLPGTMPSPIRRNNNNAIASKSTFPLFGASESDEDNSTQASRVDHTPSARFMRNLSLRDWEIDHVNFLKAIQKANLDSIKKILEQQPTTARQSSLFNIAEESSEWTALHFLADGKSSRIDASFETLQTIVRFCKFFGADFDAPDSQGMTPLMLACASCDLPLVMLLLENKANINAQDHDGHTAIDYVRISPSSEAQALSKWLVSYQKYAPLIGRR